MALSPETHALLASRQERIAKALASLGHADDLPSEMQTLVARIARLVERRPTLWRRGGTTEPEASDVVARIRRAPDARDELRVSISQWQGRKRVELRQWHLPVECVEWKPKRHGIMIWPGSISAVIAALAVAEDELSGDADR